MRWAHSQVAKIGVCREAHLLKRRGQFNQPSKRVFDIIWHANSRKHNDLNVVLKVDENDKLMRILNKNAPTNWIIIVNSCCVVQYRALNINSNLG